MGFCHPAASLSLSLCLSVSPSLCLSPSLSFSVSLPLSLSFYLSLWRRDKLQNPSLLSGLWKRHKTRRYRLMVCTQAKSTCATYATVTYIYLSHIMRLNMLAGAGSLGNKDRCLTSLFVPRFRFFFVVVCCHKKYIYSLSLSLCLSLSLSLSLCCRIA